MRLVTALGAALALAFSLLTAFFPGLARVVVYPSRYIAYLPLFQPEIRAPTFFGMLVSSIGALLGLVSLRVGHARLGFAGVFLGLSGFSLLALHPSLLEISFCMFWWGPGLTMLGLLMMFWGLVVQSKAVPRLALLGCPFLLAVWLLPPLLTAASPPLLLQLVGALPMILIFPVLHLAGFLPTIVGSIIGILNKRIKRSDLMLFTFLFSFYWMVLYFFSFIYLSYLPPF